MTIAAPQQQHVRKELSSRMQRARRTTSSAPQCRTTGAEDTMGELPVAKDLMISARPVSEIDTAQRECLSPPK